MALARTKTWIAGEVLTASDLNTEFNNILTNALSLISPLTGNLAAGGNKITGLGAAASAGDALRYEQLFTTSAVTMLGAMNWVTGASVASATTLNLTTATGNAVHVTGTTTIDGVTLGSGMWRLVIFDGILTLTHHATNNNLPGGANITTAANDRALYWSDGTTVYCVQYQKASGLPVVNTIAVGSITGLGTGVATALAVNVGSAGAPVLFNGALGTPSSGSLANCTPLAASDSVAGALEIAVQSEMETGTSTTLAVTPGRQPYHPLHPKGWAYLKVGSGIVASSGLTNVTSNGTGDITFNWNFSFSSVNYMAVVSTGQTGRTANVTAKAVNTTRVVTADTSATPEDNDINIVVFGDI